MLYEEDFFHPNNQEYNEMKPKNTGLHEFAKKNEFILVKKVSGKPIKIKCYKSGGLRTRIINAITGEPYQSHLVGSKDEDLYFKMCMPSDGIFFYASPEEYESHTLSTLNNDIKERWKDKFRAALRVRQ